jgi:Membrane-fusion protein
MKFISKIGFTALFVCCLLSCSNRHAKVDAYGSFEATEIIISSQNGGTLIDIAVKEGQKVSAGQHIATIDTAQLVTEKEKITLQIDAFWVQYSQLPDKFRKLNDSLTAINRALNIESQKKQEELLQQQKDVKDAIVKQKESFSSQNKLLAMQVEQLYIQLHQLEDAIAKCVIKSPIDGTLLTQYVNQHELVGAGFPLVRIADLSEMKLKVYVSEDQLSSLKLGDPCTVFIDEPEGNLKEYKGTISHISSESEFTPKMIQTKKERVNLVYAVDVDVKNDGSIKIGMPGDVVFQ